jgi:hypothetical protein
MNLFNGGRGAIAVSGAFLISVIAVVLVTAFTFRPLVPAVSAHDSPSPTATQSPTPTPEQSVAGSTPTPTPTATPTPEGSVEGGTPTATPTTEGSVQGGNPTPEASQPDTAMPVAPPANPMALLLGLILVSSLATLALANVKHQGR